MAKTETPEERQARETVEALAEAIITMAEATRKLIGGKVKRKAIIILLAESSKLSKERVGKVLDAIEQLDKDYLNK